MNSVLQCILASPLVLDLLRSRTNIDSPTEGKLAETLINIAESRKEGRINREDLEMLKKYVSRYNERFVGYKQEDAAEFLSTLITGVGMDLESKGEELKVDGEDILLRKYEQLIKDGEEKNAKVLKASLDEMIETNDNGSSDFMNLFRTQIYSEIKCTECEYMETCFEDRIMMELDLPNGKEKTDLIKCFQKTFEKVLYGLENDNYCERCEKKTSFTREEWITRLPKIMIIHLKRFKTNEYGVQERNNKSVEFPINNLDFPRMIHFYFKEFYQEYSYDLYGISIHSGTLQGGHYTANIKNMNEDKNWYNCNDSSTRDIEQPDNFGKGPYVLFYLRNDAKE